MTYREYLTWQKFLERPTMQEYYLMQIAYEVHTVLSSNHYRSSLSLEEFQIKFRQKVQQSVDEAERIWLQMVGLPPDAFGPPPDHGT